MNLKTRVAKLEAIARERLAVAAAEAGLTPEEPQSLEELRKLDVRTLTKMCLDEIHRRHVPDTEELHRLHARYRRMPFLELARLFPALRRRQKEFRAQLDRKLAERSAQAREELARPQSTLTTNSVYDDQYKSAVVYRRLLGTFCWG